MLTPFVLLVVIAIILAVISMIWPNYPILAVAVLLIGVALLMTHRA